MARWCPSCGQAWPDESVRFCVSCGTDVTAGQWPTADFQSPEPDSGRQPATAPWEAAPAPPRPQFAPPSPPSASSPPWPSAPLPPWPSAPGQQSPSTPPEQWPSASGQQSPSTPPQPWLAMPPQPWPSASPPSPSAPPPPRRFVSPPLRPSTPPRRRRGWLIAAVAVAALAGIGAGTAIVVFRHHGGQAAGGSAAAAQQPASPSSSPQSGSPGTGTEQAQVAQVTPQIQRSVSARATVVRATRGVGACRMAPGRAIRLMNQAISERRAVIARLGTLSVTAAARWARRSPAGFRAGR